MSIRAGGRETEGLNSQEKALEVTEVGQERAHLETCRLSEALCCIASPCTSMHSRGLFETRLLKCAFFFCRERECNTKEKARKKVVSISSWAMKILSCCSCFCCGSAPDLSSRGLC